MADAPPPFPPYYFEYRLDEIYQHCLDNRDQFLVNPDGSDKERFFAYFTELVAGQKNKYQVFQGRWDVSAALWKRFCMFTLMGIGTRRLTICRQ